MADWPWVQPRLDPEPYRVGLERSDAAPGGLAIPTEVPVTSRDEHADCSRQKGREAEFIDSKGTFGRSRWIRGNR